MAITIIIVGLIFFTSQLLGIVAINRTGGIEIMLSIIAGSIGLLFWFCLLDTLVHQRVL